MPKNILYAHAEHTHSHSLTHTHMMYTHTLLLITPGGDEAVDAPVLCSVARPLHFLFVVEWWLQNTARIVYYVHSERFSYNFFFFKFWLTLKGLSTFKSLEGHIHVYIWAASVFCSLFFFFIKLHRQIRFKWKTLTNTE